MSSATGPTRVNLRNCARLRRSSARRPGNDLRHTNREKQLAVRLRKIPSGTRRGEAAANASLILAIVLASTMLRRARHFNYGEVVVGKRLDGGHILGASPVELRKFLPRDDFALRLGRKFRPAPQNESDADPRRRIGDTDLRRIRRRPSIATTDSNSFAFHAG